MRTAAKWSFYIILIILIRCALVYVPRDIDSELLPYVESFEKYTNTGIKGRYYSVKFTMQRPGTAGVAIGMNNDDAVIVRIDPIVWRYLTANQKEWLMFHELAHDLHNSRHLTSFLMSRRIPDYISDSLLEVAKKQYLKTLQDGTNKI